MQQAGKDNDRTGGERPIAEIATTIEDVEALAPSWKALEDTAGAETPFQGWRWAHAWATQRMAGPGARPRPWVVSVRSGRDAPISLIWPMQIDRHAGLTRLGWLGLPALQYGGLLHAPASSQQLESWMDTAWQALMSAPVDFADFRLLPTDSPLAGFLARRCSGGVNNCAMRVDLASHADWRAFELSLSASARRSRKKRLNRLRKSGDVQFRMIEAPHLVAGLVQQGLAWKRRWLRDRGISGSLLEQPDFAAFLTHLPAHAAAAGESRWLAAGLFFDGRPIAMDFGSLKGGVFHAYLSAYDADFAHHSPGKILLWLTLQWARENDLAAYDLLANPAPYKRDWADVSRPLAHYVRARRMSGRLYGLWSAHLRVPMGKCLDALPDCVATAMLSPLRRLRDGGKG